MSPLRVLVPLLVGALAATPYAVAAEAPAMRAVVGSASGGDPYVPGDGNGGYDVRHYRITDTYRPGSDALRGTTRLRAVATTALSAFHLDLVLTPDAVTVDGMPARFRKPNPHELRVVPARTLRAGAEFQVTVRYHGRPSTILDAGTEQFFHAPGETLAMGEPQNGPWWFAANETPADKATFDIRLRVPKGQQAVSSGNLVSRRTSGDWTTWRWRTGVPSTTYAMFFAAGRFSLDRASLGGRPYLAAVSTRLAPSERTEAAALLRRSPEVVGWLEDRFGAYPFASTGGVVSALRLPYALETQTRPAYPFLGGPGDQHAVSLLVHEQAHQWFGNSVSVRRWRDVWLNEGPATYAEWRWAEAHGGLSVAERLRAEYDARSAGASFWTVRVSDPGAARMWSEPVYVRSAMMLGALDRVAGDGTADTLLRTWATRNRHGHGTGAAFRALAEELTGQDLDTFFAAWLDTTAKPADTAAHGLG